MSQTKTPLMNLVRLKSVPILQQLHLEERLLRTSSQNWCIINDGTNQPTIVMGVSGKEAVSGLQPYPQPIMSWSGLIYNKVFQGVAAFSLRENDYVFGNYKFGGNAQSITKNRWVHHTSFLWDYELKNMAYLKQPKRAPQYREARDHLEFICRMKDYIPRSDFINRTITSVSEQFSLTSIEKDAIESPPAKFAPSSRILEDDELLQASSTYRLESAISQTL